LKPDRITCSATVFGPRVHSWGCIRTGVVEREGKWYCRQHDPRAVKARRDKAEAEYRAERAAETAIEAEGERIAARLGCGVVKYGRNGYARELIITFEEAEKLIGSAHSTARGE
jgi:hypothetical protein